MAKCELLLPKILKWEGGYVNLKADKGGETNKGITLLTFNLAKAKGLILTQNIKNLTNEDVYIILKTFYWDKCKGDEIFSQSNAEIFIDWFWGSGSWAIKNIQLILSVISDGIMGSCTLSAFNKMNSEILFNAIKQRRLIFYQNIVNNNPSQNIFLQGWNNRVNSFIFNDNQNNKI